MSFWNEHVRRPCPSDQSKKCQSVTFISPGLQFTIQTPKQTLSLHYRNIVRKTWRTYSPFKLHPPQNCFPYPRVCCFSIRCLMEGKLGKGRWGEAFVPLYLLLFLPWEATETGEHPAGKCRRETWEYGCQTVATGAPGKLPTQALICCLHSSEV